MNLPFMCQVVANQISEASGLLEILSLLSLWYTLTVLEPISCLCFLSITLKNIKKYTDYLIFSTGIKKEYWTEKSSEQLIFC